MIGREKKKESIDCVEMRVNRGSKSWEKCFLRRGKKGTVMRYGKGEKW